MTSIIPQCWNCKHFNGITSRGIDVCDAFPKDGIPKDIFENKFMHTKPYEGDHGIQFEQSEESK